MDKTNLGISETDTTKFQRWRTGALDSDLAISGDTLISLWAVAKDYNTGDIGIITLFLRDYDPDTDTYASGSDPVAQGTLFSTAWQAGITGDFVQRGVLVPEVSYTIIAGHQLEAFGVVENNSSQEMWLAYDTEKYASLVNVEYDSPTPLTTYYLHDDPTPPTDDDTSSATLTMTTTAPTSTGDANGNPFNYDTDRDSAAGLKIDKTNLGLEETDSTKMQVWSTGALSSDLVISGDVIVDLWAAVKDFSLSKTGVVTMYLRDKDGSTYTEIGDTSVFDADWQEGSSTFLKKSLIIPDVDSTVSSGHELEFRLQVENQSDDAMWIAYDTVSHKSVIKLP